MKKRKNLKKYLYVYLTKNTITNKCYVGQRVSNDTNGYLGSGVILKKAIKKYGKEKFENTVLEFCDNEKHLNEREEFWIKEMNTLIPLGYNISESGYGNGTRGVEPWNKGKTGIYSKETIEKMTKGLKKYKDVGHPRSEETRRKIGEANKNNIGAKNGMFGKSHSKESKQKMRDNMKGRIPWNKGLKKGTIKPH